MVPSPGRGVLMASSRLTSVKKSAPDDIIKSIPFFTCLSEKELSDLGRIIVKRQFSKNEVILLEEDTQSYMYIVYSGRVKVVQVSIDGREQILAIHKKGEFFGEMALLDGKTAPATVIAMENVSIGLINRNDFDQYLLRNGNVLKEISYMLCSRLREAWMRVKVLGFADAEQRVRSVLQLLSNSHGIKDKRGIFLTLRITHKDLASYASVSRETATRILDRLLNEAEIQLIDNKYILLKPSFLKKTLIL